MDKHSEAAKVNKKANLILAAIILVIVLAVAVGVYFIFKPETPVAKIVNQPVTPSEYKFYLDQTKSKILTAYGIQPGSDEESTFWSKQKIDGEYAMVYARKITFDSLKQLKGLVEKAVENKIELTKEEINNVETYFKNMAIQQYGSEKEADKQLKEETGNTLKQLIEINKEQYLAQKAFDTLSGKLAVTDKEIAENYNKNIKNYDKVTVAHVLFMTIDKEDMKTKLSETIIKEKLQKAQEILGKVKAGEDIKELAKKYSEDPGVTTNNGEYTFTYSDSYEQKFKDWAYSVKKGDADIVETSYGYHVMKLLDRVQPTESERKQLLQRSRYQEEINKYINSLKYEKYDARINEIM